MSVIPSSSQLGSLSSERLHLILHTSCLSCCIHVLGEREPFHRCVRATHTQLPAQNLYICSCSLLLIVPCAGRATACIPHTPTQAQ